MRNSFRRVIVRSVGACSLLGTLLKLRFCAPGVPIFCCLPTWIGLCISSSIARSNPLTSLRGWDPPLPSEFADNDAFSCTYPAVEGIRGSALLFVYLAPHRTHKS